jgi:transcriptional regulator with XRE-family HTH domain
MMNLKNLRKLREKAGLTQTELGAKVGVATKTIWCWEQGINRPHRERFKKLDRILGQLLSDN